MKCRWKAGLFKQPPRLFAYLHPLLADVAVAPLVEQTTAGAKRAMCFTQDRSPVCRQIKKPGDHHHVEALYRKRDACSFGDDSEERFVACLRSKLIEHGTSGFKGHDATSISSKRNSNTPGASPNIENVRAGFKPGSQPQPPKNIVRHRSAVPAIVDSRIRREIDALTHTCALCRTSLRRLRVFALNRRAAC